MAHYIDAEQLKAELDKRYTEYRAKMKTDDFTYYEGMADALDHFEQYIDSLLEQLVDITSAGSGAMGTVPPKFKLDVKPAVPEVNINKEIDDIWRSLNTGHDYVIVDSYQDFLGICMHCFEFGLNARKEDK